MLQLEPAALSMLLAGINLKQVFGSGKSEKLDKNQLGLGIDQEAAQPAEEPSVAVPAHERKRRAPAKSKEESYAHLPIKVIDPDHPNNRTRPGWLWPISRPGGDVVFTWSMTRGASHLDTLLEGLEGFLQSDAYSVYEKYDREHDGITALACMAHIRRQFDKAKDESEAAKRLLAGMAPLYRIEKELHETGADSKRVEQMRQSESLPILEELQRTLIEVRQAHLPKSLTGKACDYALGVWDKAKVYCQRGDLQIDNNLIENAIRPSAIGKKNWLFIDHPNAGKRSAIIYSIVVSCQRHGICPAKYLQTVLAEQNLLIKQDPTGLTPAEIAAQD